jgi:hypothetical protein
MVPPVKRGALAINSPTNAPRSSNSFVVFCFDILLSYIQSNEGHSMLQENKTGG